MQPGMLDGCLIRPDSFLLRGRFEELELHQSFPTADGHQETGKRDS
jgi:hypothetical protein